MKVDIQLIHCSDTYEIRHKVLWPNKLIEHVKIKEDDLAIHLGAFVNKNHIGVVSIFSNNEDFQFRKLAVLEDFRGYGIGTTLILECIQIAAKKGAKKLWCDARQDAICFYQKLGFEIDSTVFTKSGILYQKAFRLL